MGEFNQLNVLVAEDHVHMRKIVKTVLVGLGVKRVVEASTGVEAWDALSGKPGSNPLPHGQKFNLIVCDWMMPAMSGIELLRKIRADRRLKEIPFLMLTAESDSEKVREALQEGVTDYIVKPFTAKLLEAKLRSSVSAVLEEKRK